RLPWQCALSLWVIRCHEKTIQRWLAFCRRTEEQSGSSKDCRDKCSASSSERSKNKALLLVRLCPGGKSVHQCRRVSWRGSARTVANSNDKYRCDIARNRFLSSGRDARWECDSPQDSCRRKPSSCSR